MDIVSPLGNDRFDSMNKLVDQLKFRLAYVFVIGKGTKPMVSIPTGNGIRLTVAEERDRRLAAKAR